jgi:hypothetical protein
LIHQGICIISTNGCPDTALRNGGFSPDLAVVVDAWPDLPGAMKAGILAMVKAARG